MYTCIPTHAHSSAQLHYTSFLSKPSKLPRHYLLSPNLFLAVLFISYLSLCQSPWIWIYGIGRGRMLHVPQYGLFLESIRIAGRRHGTSHGGSTPHGQRPGHGNSTRWCRWRSSRRSLSWKQQPQLQPQHSFVPHSKGRTNICIHHGTTGTTPSQPPQYPSHYFGTFSSELFNDIVPECLDIVWRRG
jgi:hypothetical protein